MKTSIALIGFMASGKTAVAQALASKLDKKLAEIDALIEQRASQSIEDIFAREGETVFRQLEIETIEDISGGHNQVIACGGGAVLNRVNIDNLKKEAVIIYLDVSPEVALERAQKDATVRPLLKVKEKAAAINTMMNQRRPLYEQAADIKIDTSGLDVIGVADEIIRRLKNYEDFA